MQKGGEFYENGVRKSDVKKGYIFMNICTIALGFMQYGIGMNSWTNSSPAFARAKDWDPETKKESHVDTIVQSVMMLGAMIGALSCAKLLFIGKFKLIFILNAILCTGVAITIITSEIWVICIGRFFWGYAFGCFSVVCAKFVDEIKPIEHGGSFGAINQLACCLGQAVPCTLSLAYPVDFNTVEPDSFYVTTYWRIIFGVPFLIAALQVLLLLTCFRHESPVFLMEQGQDSEALLVLRKFYAGKEVDKRLAGIQAMR